MSSRLDKNDKNGNAMVRCEECGMHFHSLSVHLKSAHGIKVAEYTAKHPGVPTMSEHARNNIAKAQKARRAEPPPPAADELVFGVARLKIRTDVSPEDAPFVPKHDENFELDDDKLESAALAIQDSENIMCVGPTGCGKSAFWLELAAIVNQPVRRLNLHGDVRSADFVGEKVVDVDAESGQAIVFWRDGILPDAMRKGYWLLLDELDAGPAAILFVLQAVLEEHRKLVLSANHGEVVSAHPNFRIIATANTLGRGDDSGLYTGTNVLNEAFLDRFHTVIQWDNLSPTAEAAVLVAKTGIKADKAKLMVECATLVRSGFGNEECFCTFSTRRLLAWARKTVRVGRHWKAAGLTIFNKLSDADREYVEGIIQRVMGKR